MPLGPKLTVSAFPLPVPLRSSSWQPQLTAPVRWGSDIYTVVYQRLDAAPDELAQNLHPVIRWYGRNNKGRSLSLTFPTLTLCVRCFWTPLLVRVCFA